MKYKLPYFGELDLEALEDYYQVEIEFEGKEVQLDLNFEDPTIDVEKLDVIKQHLENLSELDNENKVEIEKDFRQGKEVKNYIEDQLANLDEEDLRDILEESEKDKSKAEQMLEALHLTRVGFYPESENSDIAFDYTLSADYIDDVLVLFRESNGDFNSITIES